MKGNYYKIKQYSNVVKDYPLFFTFAKRNRFWKYLYPIHKDDLFQIIALAALSPGTMKDKNLILQRELYHFYNHVIINYKIKKKKVNNTKKYNKQKPNYYNQCNLCLKIKKQYMYKSFIPEKIICSACYMFCKRHGVK